jgi:hypothetical protein
MVVLPILTKLTRVSVWAMLFLNKFRTPFRQAVAPSINITLYLVISGSPTALSIRAQWPCLPCNRFQLCSKSNFQMAWSEKLSKLIHQTNLSQYEMVLPRSHQIDPHSRPYSTRNASNRKLIKNQYKKHKSYNARWDGVNTCRQSLVELRLSQEVVKSFTYTRSHSTIFFPSSDLVKQF